VKNRAADNVLVLAETHFPGLRKWAEVIEVSTPITNMRYAGQLGGSIYGFDQPPGESTLWRMKYFGPLSGLFFVGAWTPPGGGFEPAMISGRFVGEIVSRIAKSKGRKGAEQ
jgi:all-trans-retinol 13,14-reductase